MFLPPKVGRSLLSLWRPLLSLPFPAAAAAADDDDDDADDDALALQ